MVFMRSALPLALIALVIVQYPFLWELLPDFTAWYGQLGTLISRRHSIVNLSQGIVYGERTCLSNSPIERFLGIPFAVPPVGNLRFDAPRAIPDDPNRIIKAQNYGPSCIQVTSRVGSYRVGGHVSEDCLTVNVIRPASTDASAKLPVMVWIYGGGFISGASVVYDGSELVKQSLAIKRPVIYVSMNYRLNLFGFLASSEVEKRAKSKGDAVLNAGLLDQRLALEWVQKNIDAFGGDKDKVVLFGESAGAMSIGAHLLSNHGKHSGLFRGAILESGGSIGIPVIRPKEFDASYAKLVERVACNSSSSSSVFDCLRTVPVDTLQTVLEERRSDVTAFALREQPNSVVQDDEFYHARPSEAFKAGEIARVPTIIGTVLDEGAGFGINNLKSEKELREATIENWVFNKPKSLSKTLNALLRHYPDIPSLGSPYPSPSRTPGSWDDNSRIFEPLESNQFKRASSIIGDLIFESGRRVQLDDLARAGVPVWNYRFMQPPGNRETYMGTYHGSEIRYVFAWPANQQDADGEISRMMSRAWIHFAHDLDPNGPELPSWPAFSLAKRESLQILYGNSTVIRDDYRKKAIDWMGRDYSWLAVTGR